MPPLLTDAQYNVLLEYQGGGCALCGRPPTPGRRLATDHSHKTGIVRGLLCPYHNRYVVGRHEDGNLLIKAGEYLNDPPALHIIGTILGPKGPLQKRRRKRRANVRKPTSRARR